MKIALIADLHLQGKTLSKCITALDMANVHIDETKCDAVAFLGDVFHKGAMVADRYGSTGDLQRVILDFINKQISNNRKVILIEGSHDHAGQNRSALEFLRGYSPLVSVYDKPCIIEVDGVTIGLLPWVEKSIFYANKCAGMDRTDANAMYTKAIHASLGIFRAGFEGKKNTMLLGHCEVQGSKVNPGYVVQGGMGYSFTEGQLDATGADYIALGHIHKKMGYYVGHLYQDDFGDEGNPQGFYIATIEDDITDHHYVLPLPEYFTIEVSAITDMSAVDFNPRNHYKLRFHSETAYEEYLTNAIANYPNMIIEKLWGKTDYVSRTATELSTQMSEGDLLAEYIKINPLPEGVSLEALMEVLG